MKILCSVMRTNIFREIFCSFYKRFIEFKSLRIYLIYTRVLAFYIIIVWTFFSTLFNHTQLVYAKNFKNVILGQSTTVLLRLTQDVSTKNMKVGDQVEFTVVEEVTVNGKTVIKSGSTAVGRVSVADKPEHLGEPGFIQIAPQYVFAVDGQEIRLAGTYGSSGKDKETSTVICAWLCLPLGLRKGGHANIAEGTELRAIVERDYEVRVAD